MATCATYTAKLGLILEMSSLGLQQKKNRAKHVLHISLCFAFFLSAEKDISLFINPSLLIRILTTLICNCART